jgi:hypothetical protein
VDIQGSGDRIVFGGATVARPAGYAIRSINVATRTVVLQGSPGSGFGPGAQLRLYDWPPSEKSPIKSPADTRDPTRSKATLVITALEGITGATASIVDPDPARIQAIQVGDLAVLAFAGRDTVRLPIRFVPEGRSGAVPGDRAQKIRDAISRDEHLKQTLEEVRFDAPGTESWTLTQASDNRLQLLDPFGILRVSYAFQNPDEEPEKVARNLGQHAKQKALLQIEGEPGSDFRNNATLKVEISPIASGQNADCDKANATWAPEIRRPGSAEVQMPLGACWQIKVRLADDAPRIPLFVGGVLLTADGGVAGFPNPAKLNQIPTRRSLQAELKIKRKIFFPHINFSR